MIARDIRKLRFDAGATAKPVYGNLTATLKRLV